MRPEQSSYQNFYSHLFLEQVPVLELHALQFEESAGEKTEEPTEKRLQKAREKGNVAKSQDLTTAITLIIVTLFMYAFIYEFYDAVHDMFLKSVQMFEVQKMTGDDMWTFVVDISIYWWLIMVPVFFVSVLVTMTASILQVGLNFSTEAMMPDLQRFNPIQGAKKIFGVQAVAELVKSMIKLVVLAYFPYKMYVNEFQTMTSLLHATIGDALDYVTWLMVKLILEVGLVLIIYGIFDYIWTAYKRNKDLKMTKEEVKQERKQMDGDPQIKARIRQKQRELAQRQMMGEVPKADVVVTNPTHFAVALKYDRSVAGGAPIVVAKGKNLIAQKIKEIAWENDVPVIENVPLARSLFRHVELGELIPEDLYQAVATVLAQAYKMKRKAG